MRCAGHPKAVAYVRYLNDHEVVSASTDSTLRLWNMNNQKAARIYEGHVNAKNFVGLSADGDFIACGSELNEVHPPTAEKAVHPASSPIVSSASSWLLSGLKLLGDGVCR